MAADFTFDPTQDAAQTALAPLYSHILGAKKVKPTVSLGAVDTADAQAWLQRQHDTYRKQVGERSTLILNMNILDKVTLVDLTDAPAP